jgi:hypothetical protein
MCQCPLLNRFLVGLPELHVRRHRFIYLELVEQVTVAELRLDHVLGATDHEDRTSGVSRDSSFIRLPSCIVASIVLRRTAEM